MEVTHVPSFLIGSNKNMTELYQEMTGDPPRFITGYFCDVPSMIFRDVPYLGQPKEVVTYLQQHHIEQVYCCLLCT